MKIQDEEILRYVEPVLRYCTKRLSNRTDAEDLAGEIMLHVLSGIKKYDIGSIDKWVWRIAANRYARFIRTRERNRTVVSDDELFDIADDYDVVDKICVAEEHAEVFQCLHSLAAQYRNILVDYYVGGHSVNALANKYGITDACVKWRLNIGRERIKERMGYRMDKVYKRINWNTGACNGSMDSDKYLHTQLARAICLTAYEKPLTVEEISMKTGIPALYIEDELPRLEHGDAITCEGGKYAANFILLRLVDKAKMEGSFKPLVKAVADHYEKTFAQNENMVKNVGFYGADFGMKRLGYIALSASLRGLVYGIKDADEQMKDGPFPPRKDGGYGWFIIKETENETEQASPYASGCNQMTQSNPIDERGVIKYYWIGRYFDERVYHKGIDWMSDKGLLQMIENGMLPAGKIGDQDAARLIRLGLIEKSGGNYRICFPCFTPEEYDRFTHLFRIDEAQLTETLHSLIVDIWQSFKGFVPKRLDSQINQYVSCYAHNIIGFVAEELIRRGVLESPLKDKALTAGIFYIKGVPLKLKEL